VITILICHLPCPSSRREKKNHQLSSFKNNISERITPPSSRRETEKH